MTFLRFIPKKMVLLFLGDAFLIAGAYYLAQFIWLKGVHGGLMTTPSWSVVVFLLIYIFIFYVAEFYDPELHFANVRYLFKHLAGTGTGAVLVAVVFFLVPDLKSGRGVFVLSATLIGAFTYAWRLVFAWWFKNGSKAKKRLLIVGAGKAGRMLYHAIKDHPDYQVLGFMVDDDPAKWKPSQVPSVIGGSDGLRGLIKDHGVRVLVLAITNFKDTDLLKSALECKLDGVTVSDMPSFYEKVTGKVPVEHVTDFWLVFTPLLGVKKSAYTQKAKRVIDLVLSSFGLILTLPLAGLIAAAIKLDSGGPVLYLQPRVGLNGETFRLVKFRSMKNGTDNDRKFAGERSDPRVTRVGRVIRYFRMDEIPQMWNVLKGEMSFIGPRALIEEEVSKFEEKIPYFSLRHSVRPGVTGWAQVNYKHGARIEDGLEKLQYDLFYIKNLSPLLDFHILAKTVKVVLSGKGAR